MTGGKEYVEEYAEKFLGHMTYIEPLNNLINKCNSGKSHELLLLMRAANSSSIIVYCYVISTRRNIL